MASFVLSGLCRHLVESSVLAESPCFVLDTLDAGRDPKRISWALTVTETDALIGAALDPRRRLLYRLQVRTGIRVREATRLEWSDLDLDAGLIRLRAEITKNGQADVLPITTDLDAEIVDYHRHALKNGEAQTGLIFPAAPGTRTWRRDLTRAGVAWKLHGEQG